MTNTVAIMTDTITPDALWGVVGNVMPFALVVVLFSLGFYLVKKQTKKVAHAKAGL